MRERVQQLRYMVLFIIVLSNGMSNLFGQAQQPQQTAAETRTGCLTAGEDAGQFVLINEFDGVRTTVEGTNLDTYKTGKRATVTGTVVRQGGKDVFHIATVQQLSDNCAAIGFSMQRLKQAVGRASFGVKGGVAFDPEMVVLGAHGQLGPLFQSLWIRPTGEYDFGEVTKMFNFGLDFPYYMPFIGKGQGQGEWYVYVGAGVAWDIIRRDFDGFPNQPDPDFGDDWDFDFGIPFFFGLERQNGLFVELKAAAWMEPAVRLYVGYNFR